MNPNIDRNTLAQVDWKDFERQSRLPFNYFEPTYSYRGEWLIVAAVAVVALVVTLYYFAGDGMSAAWWAYFTGAWFAFALGNAKDGKYRRALLEAAMFIISAGMWWKLS